MAFVARSCWGIDLQPNFCYSNLISFWIYPPWKWHSPWKSMVGRWNFLLDVAAPLLQHSSRVQNSALSSQIPNASRRSYPFCFSKTPSLIYANKNIIYVYVYIYIWYTSKYVKKSKYKYYLFYNALHVLYILSLLSSFPSSRLRGWRCWEPPVQLPRYLSSAVMRRPCGRWGNLWKVEGNFRHNFMPPFWDGTWQKWPAIDHSFSSQSLKGNKGKKVGKGLEGSCIEDMDGNQRSFCSSAIIYHHLPSPFDPLRHGTSSVLPSELWKVGAVSPWTWEMDVVSTGRQRDLFE